MPPNEKYGMELEGMGLDTEPTKVAEHNPQVQEELTAERDPQALTLEQQVDALERTHMPELAQDRAEFNKRMDSPESIQQEVTNTFEQDDLEAKQVEKDYKDIGKVSKTIKKNIESSVKSRGFTDKAVGTVMQAVDTVVDGLGSLPFDLVDYLINSQEDLKAIFGVEKESILKSTAKGRDFMKSLVLDEEEESELGGFERVTGEIVALLGGFAFGMGRVNKSFRAMKAAGKKVSEVKKVAAGVALGGVVDGLIIDPEESNLANFLNEFPAIRNVVFDALATNEDDSLLERRIKNGILGTAAGGVIEVPIQLIKGTKFLVKLLRARSSKEAKIVKEAMKDTGEAGVKADVSVPQEEKIIKGEVDVDFAEGPKKTIKSLEDGAVTDTKNRIFDYLKVTKAEDYLADDGLINGVRVTSSNSREVAEGLVQEFSEMMSLRGHKFQGEKTETLIATFKNLIEQGIDPNKFRIDILEDIIDTLPRKNLSYAVEILTSPTTGTADNWVSILSKTNKEGLDSALLDSFEKNRKSIISAVDAAKDARQLENILTRAVDEVVDEISKVSKGEFGKEKLVEMLSYLSALRSIFRKTRGVASGFGRGLRVFKGGPLRGKSGEVGETVVEFTAKEKKALQEALEKFKNSDLDQPISKDVADLMTDLNIPDEEALAVMLENPELLKNAILHDAPLNTAKGGDKIPGVGVAGKKLNAYDELNKNVGGLFLGHVVSGISTKILVPAAGVLNTLRHAVLDPIAGVFYNTNEMAVRHLPFYGRFVGRKFTDTFIPEFSRLRYRYSTFKTRIKEAATDAFRSAKNMDAVSATNRPSRYDTKGFLGQDIDTPYVRASVALKNKAYKPMQTSDSFIVQKTGWMLEKFSDVLLGGMDALFGTKALSTADAAVKTFTLPPEILTEVDLYYKKLFRSPAARAAYSAKLGLKEQDAYEHIVRKNYEEIIAHAADPTKPISKTNLEILNKAKRYVDREYLMKGQPSKGGISQFAGDVAKKGLTKVPVLGETMSAFVGVLTALSDNLMIHLPGTPWMGVGRRGVNNYAREQWKQRPAHTVAKQLGGMAGLYWAYNSLTEDYGFINAPTPEAQGNVRQILGHYPPGSIFFDSNTGTIYNYTKLDMLGLLMNTGALTRHYAEEFKDHGMLGKALADGMLAFSNDIPMVDLFKRSSDVIKFFTESFENGRITTNSTMRNLLHFGMIKDMGLISKDGIKQVSHQTPRVGQVTQEGEVITNVAPIDGVRKAVESISYLFNKNIYGPETYMLEKAYDWDGNVLVQNGYFNSRLRRQSGPMATFLSNPKAVSTKRLALMERLTDMEQDGWSNSIEQTGELELSPDYGISFREIIRAVNLQTGMNEVGAGYLTRIDNLNERASGTALKIEKSLDNRLANVLNRYASGKPIVFGVVNSKMKPTRRDRPETDLKGSLENDFKNKLDIPQSLFPDVQRTVTRWQKHFLRYGYSKGDALEKIILDPKIETLNKSVEANLDAMIKRGATIDRTTLEAVVKGAVKKYQEGLWVDADAANTVTEAMALDTEILSDAIEKAHVRSRFVQYDLLVRNSRYLKGRDVGWFEGNKEYAKRKEFYVNERRNVVNDIARPYNQAAKFLFITQYLAKDERFLNNVIKSVETEVKGSSGLIDFHNLLNPNLGEQ